MATKATTSNGKAKDSLIERIEADLLSGHFRPGEWLKQADLEAQYEANRFDVRMALMDLRARHLIEHAPNRGFRVINLSEREREELFETRTILETAAARLVAERITPAQIASLAAIEDEFAHQMGVAPVEDLRAINARFHDMFYEASGNQVLANEVKALRRRGLPGTRGGLAWRTMAGIQESHEDHLAMLDHLRVRDADRLVKSVASHLGNWRRYLPKAS